MFSIYISKLNFVIQKLEFKIWKSDIFNITIYEIVIIGFSV